MLTGSKTKMKWTKWWRSKTSHWQVAIEKGGGTKLMSGGTMLIAQPHDDTIVSGFESLHSPLLILALKHILNIVYIWNTI